MILETLGNFFIEAEISLDVEIAHNRENMTRRICAESIEAKYNICIMRIVAITESLKPRTQKMRAYFNALTSSSTGKDEGGQVKDISICSY